jgi:uncharacterized short protein YbdD (DUF466 family)
MKSEVKGAQKYSKNQNNIQKISGLGFFGDCQRRRYPSGGSHHNFVR